MIRKYFSALLLAALLATGVSGGAFAQASVQQSPTRFDAATSVATSATSGATITITPPAGQFVYVTAMDVTNCAGAAAVTGAAPTSLTSTNLGGAAWLIGSGSTAAGQCLPTPGSGNFASPLKSAASGTPVTLVLPAFATNQTLRVSAYYYAAP